jgi:ABC-type sugar transport system ATPase subunit
MVFESYALYPHMTVFENMAFSLKVRKFKKDEIEKKVLDAAKTLKIDHLLTRVPKELSGGQRQRVAIGRAIVRNPYAFLFDEPLSNLDNALRCKMRYELAKLKAQLNTTMVYVTHDQSEAMTLADKIVVMRDGIIEQEGSPVDLYNSPANIFVAKFIGSSEMNILEISFIQDTEKLSIFKLPTGDEVSFLKKNGVEYSNDKKYFLGIRPEDIEILLPGSVFFGNKLDGSIFLSENLGGEEFLHVTLKDNSQILVKAKNSIESRKSQVRLGYSFEKCYLFDETGKAIFQIREKC